jgi:hypothetical protein
MPNVTNTLIANITVTEDTTQNVVVNRTVPGLVIDSNVAEGVFYQKLTGAYTVNLPDTPAGGYQLYVRNNDTTNGVNVVANSGAGTMINVTLAPGGVILLWQNPSNGQAYTALIFTPIATPVLIEYFIGA